MALSESRLDDLAFGALEEVAAICHHRSVEHTRAIAVVLAYLAHRAGGERLPFDLFWRSITKPRQHERWQAVNASLNSIYLAAGRRRDLAVVSAHEQRARKAGGDEAVA